MSHLFSPLRIKLVGCLLLFAASAGAQIRVPYPLESFSKTTPVTTAAGVEQALAGLEIEADSVKIEDDDAVISSSLEEHHQIFTQLNPSGNWVSGYLYFKVSQTGADGTTEAIRYYAELPKSPDRTKFSEALTFKLEPIYSTQALERIAPELPEQFTAKISYYPFFEESNIISLIIEIESKDLPNIATEFCTFPDKLLELGGAFVEQDKSQIEAKWQCRLLTQSNDANLDAFKQKVQPYLDAPRATTDNVARELEGFFKSAGVDFKSNPKNNLIFDGEQIVLRLPPGEMAKARSIMEHYHEVQQSTITATYGHIKGEKHAKLGAGTTCLSGKRAVIQIPNFSLFGYESPETGSTPRMEMSFTTNIRSDDTMGILLEVKGTDALGLDNIENSHEATLPISHEARICEHQYEVNGDGQSWTLDLANERHDLGLAPPDPESKQIDFVPISRGAVIRLTNQHFNKERGPVDPFAAPTRVSSVYSNPEKSIEAYFRKNGFFKGDRTATITFDGEQLIINAKQRNIDRIRRAVLEASYEHPATGNLDLSYKSNDGELVKIQTRLVSDVGKLATLTTRSEGKNSGDSHGLSETELKFYPRQDSSDAGLEKIFATAKWKHKEPQTNQPWWLNIDQDADGVSSKQHLPPISEHSWSVEELKVFDTSQ